MINLQEAHNLPEALDAEIMNDYVVVECDDGFWSCKCYQPKCNSIDDVKWYQAKEWQVQKFHRLQGKGLGHVNDQLSDKYYADMRANDLSSKTADDYYNYDMDDAMPGAFGNEWKNVEFSL